jgi:CRISPR-associated protein Csx17
LAFYLKALGALRLVSEQVDSQARGFWKDECFHLVTRLDADGLMNFFLHDYQPSPIVAPWNKGSGFYQTKDPGIYPVETSSSERFAPLRDGIQAARRLIDEIAKADAEVRKIKDETKTGTSSERARLRSDPEYKQRLAKAERRFKDAKQLLIPRCRKNWRGREREWFDAALVLDGDLTPVFPALLGTGGNDGRLDFTNNYYQRLADLFVLDSPEGKPQPSTRGWLLSALWGTPLPGAISGVVGQFMPGSAGGANTSNGPTGSAHLNPVDFVFTLEGAINFRSAATKRLDGRSRVQASVPFAFPSNAAGYTTAAVSDEGGRGEQWMPLWDQPLTYQELLHFLKEGRARLGSEQVQESLDFAQCIARLGTARGIVAFQRFGYVERNGQSNLAVPMGRFFVHQGQSSLDNLDALAPWILRLRRQARTRAPTRLIAAEKLLVDAIFDVSQHPEEPLRWQQILLSLANIESVFVSGTGFAAGPVPPLNPKWVQAADDGSPEFRLAVAFALQRIRQGKPDGVRRHWLPLNRQQRFETTGDRGSALARRPDVVMFGRDGIGDALAVVERRLVEASQSGQRQWMLEAARRTDASLSDLTALLSGEVDITHTMNLAKALMAIDPYEWQRQPAPPSPPSFEQRWPDDSWVAIRLALLPWPLDHVQIPTDPAIVRRLSAGDTASAVRLALQRLRAAGLRCPFSIPVGNPDGRLWGAALAFPISLRSARQLARRFDPASTITEMMP